ncbi:MAG: hypothetical protein QG594_2070 [Bacteroidota bacterium]|nr:hypothetical protein [Bacteroidota bacterium]
MKITIRVSEMDNPSKAAIDKKDKLLSQLQKIQAKIDSLENQRLDKITRLVKKFKILDLSDEIIEQEFALIRAKYSGPSQNEEALDSVKKN